MFDGAPSVIQKRMLAEVHYITAVSGPESVRSVLKHQRRQFEAIPIVFSKREACNWLTSRIGPSFKGIVFDIWHAPLPSPVLQDSTVFEFLLCSWDVWVERWQMSSTSWKDWLGLWTVVSGLDRKVQNLQKPHLILFLPEHAKNKQNWNRNNGDWAIIFG